MRPCSGELTIVSAVIGGNRFAELLDERTGNAENHSRDCKQVNIGMVVTKEGLPVGYEIFAGNTTEVTILEDMVELMEKKQSM